MRRDRACWARDMIHTKPWRHEGAEGGLIWLGLGYMEDWEDGRSRWGMR